MTEMYIANICTIDTQSETCKLQRPGQNMSHLLLRIDANDSVNPVFHCEDAYNGPINMHAQIHAPSWFKSVSSPQTKGQHACVLQLRICFHNLLPQSLGLMLPGEPSGGETVLPGDCFYVISGLHCDESSPLPSELEHQWSSGQPLLSELQWGYQSPQSHILRREATQYSVARKRMAEPMCCVGWHTIYVDISECNMCILLHYVTVWLYVCFSFCLKVEVKECWWCRYQFDVTVSSLSWGGTNRANL